MSFYRVPSAEDEPGLRQGDILSPVPFVGFSLTDAHVVRAEGGAYGTQDLSQGGQLPAGTRLLVSAESCTGMVLNQSCDLSTEPGRRKPVLVARVVPCAERIAGFPQDDQGGVPLKKMVGMIRALANPGRTPSLFYLPAYAAAGFELQRSVVDLLEVACFPPGGLVALAGLRRLRLVPAALQALQERVAYCFGRFGAPDDLYYSQEEWAFVQEQGPARRRGAARP